MVVVQLKLIDFKEEKAKIQGIHTPKALFSDMINRADDMEMAIVVYKTNYSLVIPIGVMG